MGTRAMKQDLFAIKAVKAKGYDIQELILRSDEELDELQLPVKLIQAVKEYKQRGGKSAQEIAEEIAEIMVQESPEVDQSTSVDDAVTAYKTNTDEQQAIIEEIQSTVVIPEDEVEVVRIESAQEDVDVINTALKEKEFKSFAPYLKHLKSAVPAQILSSVDGTKVNELIEKRISEIKAKDESTK
ncbi:hypothetical protein pEaSNUABM19_00299 [Erwinia phage pEa_SNUABM_19]|nr:hypothetical protein pEaSNUABM19_00299 [Erwinia phage pEa_SNUABM_19]QXO11993.1 hypothetical protein pEaSNUABM44_00297 [Erwinia phage pEa_SNUABM_44]QXO12546.1 hypothetical protein pEaSNUABM49_00300 [Erwinia phage pEa_SNUABM_49]